MSKLKGKVALVTGSGRGIGRAIALKLASEGAKLVVNDLDAAPGDAVAAEIRAAGGEAVAVNGSVSEAGFADRFVGAGMTEFGGLDIIVNNAGYTWDCDDPEDDATSSSRPCSTCIWSRRSASCARHPSRSG